MNIKKLDLKSMDIVEEKREQLKALFPEAFTEGQKIDFERLKLTLGEMVDPGKERYGMNWPGKADCFKIIQQPSIAALTPARNESVDFDTTENLFIEGDNLEILKLLQKSYFGKVKMIYIDPPYNTGNDFIYPDDYSESLDTYLRYTGQIDNEGRKYSTNTEADGRFHSKWMDMMYPRLFLARNLLREDGVIFVSIDEKEIGNLLHLMNEIFGEENKEGIICWRRRYNQPNDKTKMIGKVAEWILSYARNSEMFKRAGVGKVDLSGSFSNPDNDPRGDWASKPWKVGSDQSGSRYKIITPKGVVYDEEWMGDRNTYGVLLADNRIIFPDKGKGSPRKKYFRSEREEEGQCATNWWPHEEFGHNQGANSLMTELFEMKNVFSNPKPIELIRGLIQISNAKDGDLILDFFAGSGTLAHAVIQTNIEDKSGRKFILVQLPEQLDEENKDHKIAFDFCKAHDLEKNIAEIGKERIRRVIKKIKVENEKKKDMFTADTQGLDLGFKVFKLQPSNFKLWDGDVAKEKEAIKKQIELFVEHINPQSSQEDILYEILLKSGFPLTTKIEKTVLAKRDVFSIADGSMLICLEKDLTPEVIKAMAEMKPVRVVCLDEGFKGNDQLKTNAVQIMKTRNITFRTV